MNEGKWFIAAVCALVVGYFIGNYSGKATVQDDYDRLFQNAGLPSECEHYFDRAIEVMNREDEMRSKK